MATFDYPYTCPAINKNIEEFKADIEGYISNILEESSPLLYGDHKINYVRQYSDEIYYKLEHFFEDMRKENEEMRNSAEKQIQEKENEIDDLKSDIENLEARIMELEQTLNDYEF